MRRGADRVRSLGNHAIGIHPGSGSPRKNWPLERFVQVARLVEQRGVLRPLFLLGEAEGGMDAQLSRLCPGLSCLKGAELLELAGTLSHCRGYVGNDSGVTHLAAALGVPVVAIFGPTDPAVWAPRGAQVRVVRAEVVTPAEVADLLEMEPN
jgi:ADP-heptose:LPS heptosyltransferase